MDIQKYWSATLSQNEQIMRTFFHDNAFIRWHNTNERFTLEEFLIANCEYPGEWKGIIERIEKNQDLIITVCRMNSMDDKQQFHVCSFFKIKNDKIISLDEYWGDDGKAPKWRVDKKIGSNIVD